MITISRALQAHLAQPYQTTTTCWLVRLTNGAIRGFTSLDRDLTFNLEAAMAQIGLNVPISIAGSGEVTYAAASGYVPTDVAGAADLSPDNSEVDGVLVSPSITESDLYAGIWDFAGVVVFVVNWSDFTNSYPISALTRSGATAVATIGSAAIAAMGLQNGDSVEVFLANNAAYNISAVTTAVTGNVVHYAVVGTPPTPDPSTVAYLQRRQGALILRAGRLGHVTVERNNFKANLQGVTQAYSRSSVELTSPACRADLGDSRCKVPLVPPTWQAGHSYAQTVDGDASIGSVVLPTVASGLQFFCTQAGVSGGGEPAWNATIGGTTNDGGVIWTTAYAFTVTSVLTGVGVDNQTMYDTTLVQPGPAGGIAISGVTQANPGIVTLAAPINLPNGAPVTISGVTGMTQINTDTILEGVNNNQFSLGIDTTHFPAYAGGGTVTPLGGTTGFFDYGVVKFLSGLNAGLSMEVRNYLPGQFTLQLQMPYLAAIGDSYTMHAGCGKGLVPDCKNRFDNILNFRGEPYLPGLDVLIQVGKQGG